MERSNAEINNEDIFEKERNSFDCSINYAFNANDELEMYQII